MRALQLSLDDALAAREHGITAVLKNADAAYKAKYLEAIQSLAARGQIFVSDDIREIAGDPPTNTHPNVAGALVRQAIAVGLIKTVGFGCSRRVKGHGNIVRLLKGVATS